MSQDRIRRALDQLLYLPHLQAQHAEPSLPVAAAPTGSGNGAAPAAAGRGRPWDRGDLFRRLATFKSSTWFCKPQCISPVECARRGWTNTGTDLLTCEFCKAKLSCPIAADLLPEQAAAAGQRYAEGLSAAHDAACPWRTATSAHSLLQFPPLTEEAVRRDFEARCAALHRLLCLPPIVGEPLNTVASAASHERLAQLLLQGQLVAAGQTLAAHLGTSSSAGAELAPAAQATPPALADMQAAVCEGVAVLGSSAFEARARLLALCGWDLKVMIAAASGAADAAQPAGGAEAQAGQAAQQRQAEQGLPAHVGPESAALQCSLCAAKAGLWAFFPQCKPQVLPAPRRQVAGSGSGASAAAPRAALAKASVSRNVAADIGTTIAGGAMQPAGAAAAAAPFGGTAAEQPLLFGGPSGAAEAAAAMAMGAPAVAAANGGAAQPGGSQPGQASSPAAAPAAAAAAGPFGGGPQGGSVPAFGFAALQAARPAGTAAVGAGGPRELTAAGSASAKRKQPDFSWSAVMADIDAKAAAEKRSRAAAAQAQPAGGAAGSGSSGTAPAAAAAGRNGSQQQGITQQQQAAVVAAAASKYGAVQASPMDPLALHRPFCPWVNCTQAGEKEKEGARCGWRWCLQQLAAAPSAAEAAAASVEDEEEGRQGGGREWDPAKLLRQVLQQVDVHK